jgi:hypothetical protein
MPPPKPTPANEASIYIDRSTVGHTNHVSLSLKDKETSSKELLDYLVKTLKELEDEP